MTGLFLHAASLRVVTTYTMHTYEQKIPRNRAQIAKTQRNTLMINVRFPSED
jgi:hypothetical protein